MDNDETVAQKFDRSRPRAPRRVCEPGGRKIPLSQANAELKANRRRQQRAERAQTEAPIGATEIGLPLPLPQHPAAGLCGPPGSVLGLAGLPMVGAPPLPWPNVPL